MGLDIQPADFTNGRFPSRKADASPVDWDHSRRFHLIFSYVSPKGFVSHGEEVIRAENIDQAAAVAMRSRQVDRLLIRKRAFYGHPASESDEINTVFELT